MQYLVSEGEAQYMDAHHGHFSKKLAEWAISNMRGKRNGGMAPVTKQPVENVEELLRANGIRIPEESVYDAWYLYHMCLADYPQSLDDNRRVARYIEETICDPDGEPTMVLACFRAKMDVKQIPINWERML